MNSPTGLYYIDIHFAKSIVYLKPCICLNRGTIDIRTFATVPKKCMHLCEISKGLGTSTYVHVYGGGGWGGVGGHDTSLTSACKYWYVCLQSLKRFTFSIERRKNDEWTVKNTEQTVSERIWTLDATWTFILKTVNERTCSAWTEHKREHKVKTLNALWKRLIYSERLLHKQIKKVIQSMGNILVPTSPD